MIKKRRPHLTELIGLRGETILFLHHRHTRPTSRDRTVAVKTNYTGLVPLYYDDCINVAGAQTPNARKKTKSKKKKRRRRNYNRLVLTTIQPLHPIANRRSLAA